MHRGKPGERDIHKRGHMLLLPLPPSLPPHLDPLPPVALGALRGRHPPGGRVASDHAVVGGGEGGREGGREGEMRSRSQSVL